MTAAGPNTAVLTPVDLGAVLDSGAQGIFRLTVDQEQGWGLRRSKWIVATDLGLVVKQAGDDLLVAVTSVSRLAPVGGATVQVYSRNNQLLATGKTDAQGWVVLSDLPEEGFGQRSLRGHRRSGPRPELPRFRRDRHSHG